MSLRCDGFGAGLSRRMRGRESARSPPRRCRGGQGCGRRSRAGSSAAPAPGPARLSPARLAPAPAKRERSTPSTAAGAGSAIIRRPPRARHGNGFLRQIEGDRVCAWPLAAMRHHHMRYVAREQHHETRAAGWMKMPGGSTAGKNVVAPQARDRLGRLRPATMLAKANARSPAGSGISSSASARGRVGRTPEPMVRAPRWHAGDDERLLADQLAGMATVSPTGWRCRWTARRRRRPGRSRRPGPTTPWLGDQAPPGTSKGGARWGEQLGLVPDHPGQGGGGWRVSRHARVVEGDATLARASSTSPEWSELVGAAPRPRRRLRRRRPCVVWSATHEAVDKRIHGRSLADAVELGQSAGSTASRAAGRRPPDAGGIAQVVIGARRRLGARHGATSSSDFRQLRQEHMIDPSYLPHPTQAIGGPFYVFIGISGDSTERPQHSAIRSASDPARL